MAFQIATGYVQVQAQYNRGSFHRAAQQAGHASGNQFANAFGLASARRFRRMMRLFMDPINAVSSALSAIRGPSLRAGILSTLLGLVPSAGKAATAIGAGLVPALLSLGSVLGVTRLMLGDLGKTIQKQVLKQLNDMAGSMRELAVAAAKPGFNEFLAGVAKNGPMFERYIRQIAQAIGAALGSIGELLDDAGFAGKLQKLLDSAARGTASWTRSLDDVVEMLVTLGAAAGPIFEDFAMRISMVTNSWRNFLNLKYETGELQSFLRDAAEELERWGRIFNNVIIGLFNIFAAGVGPSGEFAANLERITASFRAWTEESENVEKVRRFFQFMVDHVDDFFRIAASALAIATALKGVGLAVEAITWARMLAMLGPVGIALGVLGLAIAGVAAGFFLAYNSSELFRAKVGELWAMVQERVFPILKEWAAWIEEKLVPVLETLATTILDQLVGALDYLLTKYKENEKGIKQLREILLTILPALGLVALGAIAAFTVFASHVIIAIGWAGRIAGAIRGIPTVWRTLFFFLVGGAFGLIFLLTSSIKGIPKVWSTIYKFLGMAGAVSAIKAVIGWLSRIPRSVTTVLTTIKKSIIDFVIPGGAAGGIMGARGLATGGISGGSTVLVGEQGPELVNLPYGSRVVPSGQSKAQLAGGGGAQTVVLEIRSGGSRLDDLLVELLRKSIRSHGGIVQEVLGTG